jgi:SAM-dependent methyltransferase
MTELCFSPFCEEMRPAQLLWQVGPYRIVRCAESGLVYLGNPPSAEQLRAFYSVEYFEGDPSRKGYASYNADEDILRRNFRDLARRVCDAARKQGRNPSDLELLDYGCAYGYFLDEARSSFASVRGIETNPEVAEIGRTRFGLRIDSGADTDALLEPEKLDVITLWDVIEHLARPRSALKACARALRPGRQIHLTTGNISSLAARVLGRRWRLINPPQHISYFSMDTLSRLLTECGFQVTGCRSCGKRVSLEFIRFILQYLAGRTAGPPSHGWLWRRSVYVNLFDVMYITAVRTKQTI